MIKIVYTAHLATCHMFVGRKNIGAATLKDGTIQVAIFGCRLTGEERESLLDNLRSTFEEPNADITYEEYG